MFETDCEYIAAMCGYMWTPIKTDEKGTYYLMDGYMDMSEFGKNNNYTESRIRRKLNNSQLAERLKNKFGDRLAHITTDLLSYDGFNNYGIVEEDILSIPTLRLYLACKNNIPKHHTWWLSTPDSSHSDFGSYDVLCVCNDSNIYKTMCFCYWHIRPFFILKN